MLASLRQTLKKMPGLILATKKIQSHVKYRRFRMEFNRFASLTHDDRFPIRWEDRYPCLDDRTDTTSFDRHYVYHTAWAARILARTLPAEHVDIASYVYFVALVSAFVPIKFYDYRPPEIKLRGLEVAHADLTALPFPDASIRSLSCMHVVEHIGLGRYGDPLDPEGDLKAISELRRVLATTGDLIFVVPIGKPRVMFNAHRIYSYDQIIRYFYDLELVEFTLIPDDARQGGLVEQPSKAMVESQLYGCGCFWFRKPA